MTWISLICLFVLASSAFGRSAYDSAYGAPTMQQVPRLLAAIRDHTVQRQLPIAAPTYGQQQPILTQRLLPMMQQPDMSAIQHQLQGGYGSPSVSKTLPVQGYGQGYGALPFMPQSDHPRPDHRRPRPDRPPADILCRDQKPETVIPVDKNRKFVVCLADGVGVELKCPKDLFYEPTTQRCERRLGPMEDPCASQPCLNGGKCTPSDFSYTCECAPNFDGKTCELDAHICQTQNPCGQSHHAKCQSFRLNAALQYICIFHHGHAYGLDPEHIVPSPCGDIDGPHPLEDTSEGFIMCDGLSMFVESCPGGTFWADGEKACAWPSSQGDTRSAPQQGYGQLTYGQQQRMLPQSNYVDQYTTEPQQKQFPGRDAQILAPPQYQQAKTIQPHYIHMIAPKQISSYDVQMNIPQPLDQPKLTQTYGAQLPVPQPFEQSKLVQSHVQMIAPKQFSPYATQLSVPQQPDQPQDTSSYDVQKSIPPPFEQPKLIRPPPMQMIVPKQVSSYGVPMDIPQQLEQPKQVSTYGDQDLLPQQPEQMKFSQPIRQQQDDSIPIKQSSGYGY